MTLQTWLKNNVTDHKEALAWLDGEACESRIVRAYRELLGGYDIDTTTILTETRPVTGDHPGIVAIRDINFYSLCGHHFLPFFGTIDIYYQPGKRIIGLGKFPRLVDAFARRFQIQEDIVTQIADEILSSGEAKGVTVFSRARHLCMCSRGPSDDTVLTETSASKGDCTKVEEFTRARR